MDLIQKRPDDSPAVALVIDTLNDLHQQGELALARLLVDKLTAEIRAAGFEAPLPRPA